MIIWFAIIFCLWLTVMHRRTLDSGRLAGLLALALRSGSTFSPRSRTASRTRCCDDACEWHRSF